MKCTKRAAGIIIKCRAAIDGLRAQRFGERAFMGMNLAAAALVAFALGLLTFGIYAYAQTRKPRALLPAGIAVLLLAIFFLLASRFAVQWFGAPVLAIDLRQFAISYLSVLGIGIVAGALAFACVYLARRYGWLAWGLAAVVGVLVLGGLFALTQWNIHATAAKPSDPEHPTLAEIQLPKGFKAQTFAENLQEPGAITFDDAGNLYYAEIVDGRIVRLRDTNGDGVADEEKVFASDFKNPRGLAWRDGALYVSSRGQINTLRDTNGDGVADENKVILDGLFSLDIQHSNNGIRFGPDGKLYIAIGGPRVGQLELKDERYWYQGQPRDDWQFAGVLQMDADGKNPKLYARGLRNPYDLAFGADGRLYASDNGDESIPVPDGDELNLVEEGADYGYPYFFGEPPPWSATRAPIMHFVTHAAPTGVVVYEADQFPKGYRGNVLTALYAHGQPGARYRQITRTFEAEEDGKKIWKTRSFVEGLDHPTALAIGPDGALYIADMRGGKADANFPGAIYRVTYQKQE
jgi:glucose/arabinose dehydrogenase